MKIFRVLPTLCLIQPAFAQEAETVTVAMHYTQEQAAPLLACFERYEAANPGTGIVYQQISYSEYLQTVLTARVGGTAPDIYNVYAIWGAQMVDNGLLAPAPVNITDYLAETFLPDTVGAATINDTIWGVPTEVSVYMLVSNMALLNAAGFDAPPTNWGDLADMSAQITTRTPEGRVDTAGFAFAQSSTGAGIVHPFYALLSSTGASVYEDGFASANLDSAQAQETVDRMASMVQDEITDLSIDAYDFPAGGIGMMIMANWYKSAIADGLTGGLDQVVVSQIPMGDDWRTLQYAFYMGVDSNSPVQDRAWDIIRWTNSPDSAATNGGPSCIGEMMDDLGALTGSVTDRAALGVMDDFTQAYWDALQDGRAISQPNVLQASEIERTMAMAIERAMVGEVDAATALQDLNAEVEDILAEFY